MCGLVGMAGDFMLKHRKMLTDMLYFDTLRGEDSTGLTAIRSNRTVATRKLTVPGTDFIKMPWFDQHTSLSDFVWLGHNRFRTIGSASRLNAHPFEVTDDEGLISMVGAHNGTLKNKYDIERELDAQFGTDSEALFYLIDKHGPKKAIAMTEGAWSLVWWDAYKDAIHLLRNKERPMYFAYSEDKKTVFWASEAWMISVAAGRNDVKLLEGKVWITSEDTLYTFEIPDRQKGNYTFGEHKREGGFSGKESTFFPKDQRGGNVKTAAEKTGKSAGTESSTITSNTSSNNPLQMRGYQGRMVDINYVKMLLNAGCCWCDEEMKDTDTFSWLDDSSIVCKKCLNGSHHSHEPEKKPTLMLTDKQREQLDAAIKAKEIGNGVKVRKGQKS